MGKRSSKNSSKGGWAAAVVVVIIVIATLLYISSKPSNSISPSGGYTSSVYTSSIYTSTVPPVQNIALISQGTVFSINPSSYSIVNFTVPNGAYSINVTGSYTSQGKVEVAILTPTQYGMFIQNPSSISSSQYFYGDTQGSTINAALSPGQYTLVFYDPGIITQDTVTIVNPMTLTYTP